MSAVEFKRKLYHSHYYLLGLRYAKYFREGDEELFSTSKNTIFLTAEASACYPTHIPQSHGILDVVPCYFM
jgi:hypothetical protein